MCVQTSGALKQPGSDADTRNGPSRQPIMRPVLLSFVDLEPWRKMLRRWAPAIVVILVAAGALACSAGPGLAGGLRATAALPPSATRVGQGNHLALFSGLWLILCLALGVALIAREPRRRPYVRPATQVGGSVRARIAVATATDLISPELALVAPDLRAAAIASLPDDASSDTTPRPDASSDAAQASDGSPSDGDDLLDA